jgi:hypothetical protein
MVTFRLCDRQGMTAQLQSYLCNILTFRLVKEFRLTADSDKTDLFCITIQKYGYHSNGKTTVSLTNYQSNVTDPRFPQLRYRKFQVSAT